MNHKKLLRLYREENLRQTPTWPQASDGHACANDAAAGAQPAVEPRLRQRHTGLRRRIRVLVVVDDFTRENLALVPDTSISGARVARELDAIIATRDMPLMLVSDNGTELPAWRS